MNHDIKADALRLAATAERRAEARARIEDYMNRTGMSANEFAVRIGYGLSTFRMFRADKYHNIGGDDTHIIRKATEFMEAHPVAAMRPVAGELFETENVRLIRATFAKLLSRPRAFMIYAPPGSQKSFVLEHEIYALNAAQMVSKDGPRAYLIYCRHGIRPGDLMKRIAIACGISAVGGIDAILRSLRTELTGRRVLLCFDEAQHLSLDCFEVVRELLDRDPHFSLLFSGSHDLFLKFERASATLEQWNSRIARKVRLPGCTRDEARQIVMREVGHILIEAQSRPRKDGQRRKTVEQMVDQYIKGATVTDAYVAVPEGAPKATYINIRTLTTALDELRSQYEADQPHADQPQEKESAA